MNSFCYATEFGTFAVLYREPPGGLLGVNSPGRFPNNIHDWCVFLCREWMGLLGVAGMMKLLVI